MRPLDISWSTEVAAIAARPTVRTRLAQTDPEPDIGSTVLGCTGIAWQRVLATRNDARPDAPTTWKSTLGDTARWGRIDSGQDVVLIDAGEVGAT